MNERIFEIIQDINGRVGLQWDDEDKEELAELIVRECAHIAWLNSTEDNISHTVIKQHFGVTE